jgi:acetate kinase
MLFLPFLPNRDAHGRLGLELDAAGQRGERRKISAVSSRITDFVIPTDEEQVIADEAASVLNRKE